MAKIAICVPSQDTWKAPTATFVAALSTYTEREGHSVFVVNHERCIISESRNDIVRAVLSIEDVDYIFWVDSDIVGDARLILKLLAHDKEIVGVRYPSRMPPNNLLGELLPGDIGKQEGDLVLAKTLPMGCALVRTSVYRGMGYPWYFLTNFWLGADGPEAISHQLYQSLPIPAEETIQERIEHLLRMDEEVAKWLNANQDWFCGTGEMEPKTIIGEDIAFCKKARMLGYDVWADESLTSSVGHLATVPLVYRPDIPHE